MRRARVRIASYVLRREFAMPTSASVVAASWDLDTDELVLLIDDFTLPESSRIHDLSPAITERRWDWGVS